MKQNHFRQKLHRVQNMFGKSVVNDALHEFDDALAQLCMKDIYGISDEEARQYTHQMKFIDELSSRIGKIMCRDLYDGRINGNTLSDLEETINAEIKAAEEISQTEPFRRISERRVEDKEIIDLLRKNGNFDPAKYETEWDIPGFFTFNLDFAI